MLDYVKHVVSNLEWILERCPELLSFEDKLIIPEDFLFATDVTADEFNCYQRRIQVKSPYELSLRSNLVIRRGPKFMLTS
jgi:hypothetical protein